MPRVVADHGATLLVEFSDGTQQEILRDSYQQAFPGSTYPDAGTSGGGAGPAPAPPPSPPEPSVPDPAPGMPNPTGAFQLGGPTAEPAFRMPKGLDVNTDLTPPPAAPPAPGPLPAHDPRRGQDIQLLPEYAQAERDYGAARIGAAQDLGDVESQELTHVASALDQHDQAARKIEADKLHTHQQGLKAAEARAKQIDTMAEEYRGAKIDRGRLWKNMSTGNKVLAAIGLGLSAIGQAKSRQGGMNPALQIMLGAIESDVADQRADIGKLGQSVDMKKGLYHEFLARLGNEGAAYDMALAQSAAQAKRQIEVIGAQSGSEKVKIQAQDMAAQLGEYVAGKEELVRQTAGQEAYQSWQMRMSELKQAQKGAGGGAAKPNMASSIDDLATRLGVTKREDRERIVVVDPSKNEGFLALTKDQATDVNNRLGQVRAYNSVASRLIRDVKKYGWEPTNDRWKSEAGGKMMADYQQLVAISKNLEKLGALSADDRGFIEGMLGGSPGKMRGGGGTEAQLERTMRVVNERIASDLEQFGYRGKYSPVYATENRATSPELDERTKKLEWAAKKGTPADIQEAARELIGKRGQGGLEDYYSKGYASEQAEAAIEILQSIPKKDRIVSTIDGDVDPLEYLAKFTREGGSKDAKSRAKDEEEKARAKAQPAGASGTGGRKDQF